MKRMIKLCKDCGYKEEVKIYSREEIQRLNLRPGNPCCKKCGSLKVELK